MCGCWALARPTKQIIYCLENLNFKVIIWYLSSKPTYNIANWRKKEESFPFDIYVDINIHLVSLL